MYKQVYFHPVRRIYNFHLQEFLKSKYGSEFPIKPSDFVKLTDVEVLTEIRKDLENPHAKVINERKHYRRLKIEGNSQDIKEKGDNIPKQIPEGKYYIDIYDDSEKKNKAEFPVQRRDKKIVNGFTESQVLRNIPSIDFGYIFVDLDCFNEAEKLI